MSLLDRTHGRCLHVERHPALLRPVRGHQGHRRMRDPVPCGLPDGLRGRLVSAPRPDRHRQEGLLSPARRGDLRQEGAGGDPGRSRRPHDRRQDAGRCHLEAVQGDGEPGGDARQEGPGAGEGVRDVSEPFRHRLRVRYNECDPQGHVFNANYLAYFDLAMTELWRELGGYDAMVSDGVDMVVAEANIRYLASLGFDDETDLIVRSVRLGNTSMTSELAIERGGETVAEGTLRHVFVESNGGGTSPIPAPVRTGLAAYST